MKKALTYTLAVALLLSLAACGKSQAEQPDQSEPPTQAATSTQVPESTTTPEPATTTEPTAQTPAAPEQLATTTQAAPNEADTSQPPEETESQEPAKEVNPFTEVNEQVWATGTVNLRNGAGTSYDKVGSLNAGDSVTRIGIGTGEAEGWSRIQLSNGNVVYVASSYLSTTKPVVQQQQPSQSNPTGGQQQTQTPTSGSQQSSGGSQVSDEEIQRQIEIALKQQQEAINNGATFGSGNLTDEDIEYIGTKLNGG